MPSRWSTGQKWQCRKRAKYLAFWLLCWNRVQIVETEGFDLGEPVESEYDSQDSNGKLSCLLTENFARMLQSLRNRAKMAAMRV